MKKAVLFFVLFITHFSPNAQDWKPYRQLSAAEIFHEVQKLGVTGSVLYIAAHPDDENTRVLAWLANEKKVRTAYLSLTRGDGGQNLIGTEQGEALGILRTQELLAARRIDGAEQFFTRAYDFGYSKNPEETFRFWNHDSVLSDVVWVIRNFRPDIIITRFPTTGEGGHGHHTASAILAGEAFDAAADPKRFPEQLRYVQPWQTKRLFWNTFNFGTTNTTSEDQIKVDVGGYNALLGKSYGEIASQARTMHKSQGFGTALQRGSSLEYFKQIKGDPTKADLFEGIDLTWGRMDSAVAISTAIQNAINDFDFVTPSNNLPNLSKIKKAIGFPQGTYYSYSPGDNGIWVYKNSRDKWRALKRDKTSELMAQCAGVFPEAISNVERTTLDKRLPIVVHVVNRTGVVDSMGDLVISCLDSPNYRRIVKVRDVIPFMEEYKDTFMINPVFPEATYSSPYWLSEPRKGGLFTINYPELLGRPEAEKPWVTSYFFSGGDDYRIRRPIVYKTTDPVKGEIYQPLQILPEVTLDILANSLVFENYQPKTIFVKVHCHADRISGSLMIDAGDGWAMQRDVTQVSLRKGQDMVVPVRITPAKGAAPTFFRPTFVSGEKTFNQHARLIHHSHIPDQTYLSEARAYMTAFPLQKGTAQNIGYITGAGDEVPEALRNVGYTVTELSQKEVEAADLSRYDAIVTGVRAYNTQDWLQEAYPHLMDYVKKGGNLIVQYNTNSRIGPVKAQIGPDSFAITRTRVTDEDAAVNSLSPQHPVLNSPNTITAADFAGWVQERSIYEASDWAPSFTPILSMADPGEKATNGSLIVAPYGKGNFVYTGLVFFRELPVGVPGAYRLFANLLALPKR